MMVALTAANSARGYANLYAKAKLRPEKRAVAHTIARRLNTNNERYKNVHSAVPWWWTGITHHLEASGNFTRHLHNGDPLTARTRQVPAGRPLKGKPPFSWEESARDALEMKGLHKIGLALHSIPRALFEFERYNGFGYVDRGINSPYLWSFTDLYSRGKYVADGKFDAAAVSQQCGAAAIMKALEELKIVRFQTPVITKEQGEAVQLDKALPPIVRSPVVVRPQWDVIGWIINAIGSFFK